MSDTLTTDVAVAGAGPTGLTAAITLLNNGAEVVVLDAAPGPAKTSRAALIHSRVLEVMEEMGVVDRILQRGKKVTHWSFQDCETVLGVIDFSVLEARYPFSVTLAQAETEGILRKRLEELGGKVWYGSRVTKVTAYEDEVLVQVDGELSTFDVRAKFVVAADGVHSTVRESVGIGYTGGNYKVAFMGADVKLSGMPDPSKLVVSLALKGFMLLIPLPDDTWRMVAPVKDAPKLAGVEMFQKLLTERVGMGVRIDEMLWSDRFKIQ
jgi:2-polyprenyl-6-methoxyphenol hydroxylase-like FAD-dependent oxidoreductase